MPTSGGGQRAANAWSPWVAYRFPAPAEGEITRGRSRVQGVEAENGRRGPGSRITPFGHPQPSFVVESADRMVFEQELGEQRDGEVDLAPPGRQMSPFWMRLSRWGDVCRWFSAPHARATSAVA